MIIQIHNRKNEASLAEITLVTDRSILPSIKTDWNFDWQLAAEEVNTQLYALKTIDNTKKLEGLLKLKVEHEMMIMDLIEIAPHNTGEEKEYLDIAACLIAFACRESFNLNNNYKGFLIFFSKSNLINLYVTKYGATQISGQKICIYPIAGLVLINKYLNYSSI